MSPPRLSRALLEEGGLETMLRHDAPHLRLLSDEERQASLDALLAERPDGDVWLFGYGSLIWNPMVRSAEHRVARIEGWHRDFCLTSLGGRGSVDHPGLVLALDDGGWCDGVAFRIAEADLATELPLIWRREMVAGSYVPRWVDLFDGQGRRFGAGIAFTINKASGHYAGQLTQETVVHRLATAAGSLGSCADYLLRTRDGLRQTGIPDARIEELAQLVQAKLA